jgi:hypothetical protein
MLTTPQYHRLLEQVLKEAQRKTNTLLKSLPKDFKERLAAVPKVTIRFEERHAREKTDHRARVEPLSMTSACAGREVHRPPGGERGGRLGHRGCHSACERLPGDAA